MWFEVDKEGLAKLLERRGKGFVLAELLQNAWDAPGVTRVDVSLKPVEGRALARLNISDDSPAGFKDLSHAFTLFSESEKKGDPSLRGRFNLGEKLVLALCDSAAIASTTGTIVFDKDGRHEHKRKRRASGTEFVAEIRMTRAEIAQALQDARSFIVPDGIETVINGETLAARATLRSFTHPLTTEVSGVDGVIRRSVRKAPIRVLTPPEGMPGRIYEMGIPIVETGDFFDVDIGQKVPLSLERDSVTPSYLRDVRTAVLNNATDLIPKDASSGAWVGDALEDGAVLGEAVKAIIRGRFGDKVVAYDPSDRESNDRAVSLGYTVLKGGTFSKAAWSNIRESGCAPPAGHVTPTPKPFSKDGPLAERADMTPAMNRFESFCRALASAIMERDISVAFLKDFNASAAYGAGNLSFNVSNLGKRWFEGPLRVDQLDLVIHEFGHEYCGNHLSRDFSDALTKLGAQATFAAMGNPMLFDLSSYEGPSPRP